VLERLRAIRPLAVSEKGDRLLRALAVINPEPGALFNIQCDRPALLGHCWANGATELQYLACDYLADEMGVLTLGPARHLSNNALQGVKVSPKGWHHLAELAAPNPAASRAFVAMWFDPSMDRLREEGLFPGIEAAGFEPVVVSMHQHVNRIDDEIIALIRRSRFLVADFTGTRGGVYFEAGFAHGLRLPVIWTCREDTIALGQLHFDVAHFNFLVWRESEFDSFKEALTLRIESVIGRGPRGGPGAP
jgi:hypothetical protein